MKNIAIFASGGGSNARKIIEHFLGNDTARVALVVSNRKNAGVLDIAAEHEIPTILLNRTGFYETEKLLDDLRFFEIDFIVLAGFLWLIPGYLVRAFPQKMVNIHPALLPKYGGKGMFGHHVHEAVRAAGELESGITIHFVNENYDEGDFIFQAKTLLEPDDSPEEIAQKVLRLEHHFFPKIIKKLLAT